MTDAFWNNLPILITALMAAMISLGSWIRLGRIHKQINSRMDELLDLNKKASHAKGMEDERTRGTRKKTK